MTRSEVYPLMGEKYQVIRDDDEGLCWFSPDQGLRIDTISFDARSFRVGTEVAVVASLGVEETPGAEREQG